MLDMWRYIHARTVVRVMARLRGPVPDRSAGLQAFLHRTIESRGGPAVLLDPEPGPFATLKKRWEGCSRVTPIQAALASSTGELPPHVIAARRSTSIRSRDRCRRSKPRA